MKQWRNQRMNEWTNEGSKPKEQTKGTNYLFDLQLKFAVQYFSSNKNTIEISYWNLQLKLPIGTSSTWKLKCTFSSTTIACLIINSLTRNCSVWDSKELRYTNVSRCFGANF